MLKALLVDDEVAAIRSLELLLSQFCKEIEVIGTANSGDEALEFVQKNKPDIIFLDIEMPRGSGFDFMEKCSDRSFEIIFITAYDNFALKAFKYSAIDYILKPIDIDELINAVQKVVQLRRANFNSKNKYFALFENLKSIIPNKMVVKVKNSFEYIDLTEVTYFDTHESRVSVHFVGGNIMTIDESIDDLELQLEEKNFFRIHKNILVNTDQVKKITKGGKPLVELITGVELPLDPDVKEGLIQEISLMNTSKKS